MYSRKYGYWNTPLVCVWAGATTAKTFNDFRVEIYTSGSAGIAALPPTSSGIRGHSQQGAFLVHVACHLLAIAKDPKARLEPMEHGWKEHFGILLPSKCLKPLPPSLLTLCKCAGNCDHHWCGCRAAGVSCTVFCHGKFEKSSCKNPSHLHACTHTVHFERNQTIWCTFG